MARVKFEQRPRTKKGYGIKARVPGHGATTFRAPTLNEAKRLAGRWADDVQSGKVSTSMEMTLAEYRARSFPEMKMRDTTRDSKERMWRKYIEPDLGGVPLSRLNRPEIRTWIEKLHADGASDSLASRALSDLSALLREALRDGFIESSPNLKGFWTYRRPRPVGDALSIDQMVRLVDSLTPRYATVAIVQLMTGARIGEALAIRPEDIDRQRGTLSISRSQYTVKGKGTLVGEPKTEWSRRTIPIPTDLIAILDKHMATYSLSPEGYVFTSKSRYGGVHRWLTYNAYLFHFKKVVRALVEQGDFPNIGTHYLRSTFGSHMFANVTDGDYVSVSKVLGHADLTTTLNVYMRSLKGSPGLKAGQAELSSGLGIVQPETSIVLLREEPARLEAIREWERPCGYCGKPLIVASRIKKYHNECQRDVRAAESRARYHRLKTLAPPPVVRPCEQCGEPMEVHRDNQRVHQSCRIAFTNELARRKYRRTHAAGTDLDAARKAIATLRLVSGR